MEPVRRRTTTSDHQANRRPPADQYSSPKRAERARRKRDPVESQPERSQPSSFPQQHPSQGGSATVTTESPQRRARGHRERFVTAGTVAEENLERTPTLIALAPRAASRLGGLGRGSVMTASTTVAAGLGATTCLAVFGPAITTVRATSRPTAGRLATGGAAVAIERVRRTVRPLTALQQTNPPPRLTPRSERCRRNQWTHGTP